MRAKITLVEGKREIQAKIINALKNDVNRAMKFAAGKMVIPIRQKVRTALLSQPEIASLDNGKLGLEFGLVDGLSRITSIIDYWVKNITVRQRKIVITKDVIKTSFQIGMIQSDFNDVITKEEALLRTMKGQNLPWLEWLLKMGDKSIILDYDVVIRRNNKSRTGNALMVKKKGARWGVPPEYAGTVRNNFVTRALAEVEEDINKILQKTLELSIS